MKIAYAEKIVNKPFLEIIDLAKKSIANNEFILIHEINTKEIMVKANMEIGELRQLLFFHPRYMKAILENYPSAVIRVPLKMVIREINEKQTVLTYTNSIDLFADIDLLNDLSVTLNRLITTIIEDIIN
jgi:uncharacterized protein (DUF302 family)